MKDKTLIACCGLDCGACEARKATLDDDDELRLEVSRKWCVAKGLATCADCTEKASCKDLLPFVGNETARKNLGLI